MFNNIFELIILLNLCTSLAFQSVISNRISIRSRLCLSEVDEYNGLKLDQSKLSEKEKERIEFVQKISLEADEMIKSSGLGLDKSDDEVFVEVKDTKWSGQSELEVSRKSSNNFQDLLDRSNLALGDAFGKN